MILRRLHGLRHVLGFVADEPSSWDMVETGKNGLGFAHWVGENIKRKDPGFHRSADWHTSFHVRCTSFEKLAAMQSVAAYSQIHSAALEKTDKCVPGGQDDQEDGKS